jgi:tetratricopeptide (TPR) repeat protein
MNAPELLVPMDRRETKSRVSLVFAALITATFAVFWSVMHHGLVNYDDPQYITENEHVRSGLTWANLVWSLGTGYASNWHPLTWVSHMIDVQLFGLRFGWHHLINLLLHVANVLLVFLFLRRTTGALHKSAFATSLFAIHPLHVESVAWLAERKDLLSGFFFLLALLAYAGYARTDNRQSSSDIRAVAATRSCNKTMPDRRSHLRKTGCYVLALLCFALGLMSKPMIVTLPFVLLLLDLWPLQRFSFRISPAPPHPPLGFLLLEKIPFLLLTAGSCAMTVIAQGTGGAVNSLDQLPFRLRLANAVVSYFSYLQQTFYPIGLSVFYPFRADYSGLEILSALGCLLIISAWAIKQAQRNPFWLVGWLWYLGMLVPVIGLVQVGTQARADRYTYLPLLGVFIGVSWGLGTMGFVSRKKQVAACFAASVGLLVLAGLAQKQVSYWQSTQTLFEHADKVTSRNYVAAANLATEELNRGNYGLANQLFNRALEYSTNCGPAATMKYHYGVALQLQGRGLEALPYLEQSAVPAHFAAERNYRLGISLLEAGRVADAESALNRALGAKPESPEYQLGQAALLFQQGRTQDAEAQFRSVLAKHPDSDRAHRTFADFLLTLKRPAEASAEYGHAVELQPTNAALRRLYASALSQSGKAGEATQQLEAAIRLDPLNAAAEFELGELLDRPGSGAQAVPHYARALEIEPAMVSALNNLAWILATSKDPALRNGQRAVGLAEQACKLTDWKSPPLLGTLAAAYAETGCFEKAITLAQRAKEEAASIGLDAVVKRNEELLPLYRSGKPVRE